MRIEQQPHRLLPRWWIRGLFPRLKLLRRQGFEEFRPYFEFSAQRPEHSLWLGGDRHQFGYRLAPTSDYDLFACLGTREESRQVRFGNMNGDDLVHLTLQLAKRSVISVNLIKWAIGGSATPIQFAVER